jgi:hypothetical protein
LTVYWLKFIPKIKTNSSIVLHWCKLSNEGKFISKLIYHNQQDGITSWIILDPLQKLPLKYPFPNTAVCLIVFTTLFILSVLTISILSTFVHLLVCCLCVCEKEGWVTCTTTSRKLTKNVVIYKKILHVTKTGK